MTINVRAVGSVSRAIEILTDLVGFDTTSSNSNLAMMRYISAHLAQHGIIAELLLDESGQKANLIASVGPHRPDGVILSGHTDVVPVANQHWASDPFVLTERDDRLYGRGAADMKAFIACSLAALEFTELADLQRPVNFAFSYDEEIGCLGAPRLIEHIQSVTALPAVVIVGEPSLMRIMGSHKSVHIYKVVVTGVPAHSSAVHLGISANAIAIRLMSVLLQIADALAVGTMRNTDFIPPFSTLTVGLMHGGTAANILAADASFVFDLRCLPTSDPETILEPLHAEIELIRLQYPAVTITFDQQANVPALGREPDGRAESLVRRIGGDNADMLAGSFGAEAGQFQQAGFSTVICGPGSIDQAHQADEFIAISEIEKCMQFMDDLFTAMSQPLLTV